MLSFIPLQRSAGFRRDYKLQPRCMQSTSVTGLGLRPPTFALSSTAVSKLVSEWRVVTRGMIKRVDRAQLWRHAVCPLTSTWGSGLRG